jgi:hypothetical protein
MNFCGYVSLFITWTAGLKSFFNGFLILAQRKKHRRIRCDAIFVHHITESCSTTLISRLFCEA